MVRKMNKSGFIEELVKKTDLTKDECIKLADALDDNFIIGKKNKEKTIASIIEKLGVDEAKADELYNISSSIIVSEIKNKIKHPFKSKD